MKKIMIKVCAVFLLATTGLISGCTVNLGSQANANSPAAENKPAGSQSTAAANTTAAAPAKKPDVAQAPKAGGDKSERVQFGAGKTDGSWTREIPANGAIDFVIGVKKGQTLGYEIGYDFADSDIEAFLTEPGSQDISQQSGPKDHQEFAVEKNGDHHLRVTNTTGKKITITLYLDIV